MIRSLLRNRQNHSGTAIIERDGEVPYRDIARRARALCRHLPPDKGTIAILLPNGSDYIAALWGTIGAGHTALPLNVLLTGHEMVPLLAYVSACAMIASETHRGLLEVSVTPRMPSLKIIYIETCGAVEESVPLPCVDGDTEEAMLLLPTSGTTGNPKIVRLSERNLMASALAQLEKLRLGKEELCGMRLILAVPFSSIYGMMMLSICLLRAIPIVLVEAAFTLDALFRVAEKHRATHYEGSATAILLMEQMAGRPIPYDIGALTYFGFGGSKVSGGTIEKVLRAYPGIELSQGYGMTEAAPMIAKHPRGRLANPESVGSAVRGMEIAVETEAGIVTTPYVRGEIVVRGPSVMLGYHNNEAETQRALSGGYLHTGDIGYLDSAGYLYIYGRKKNVMNVRGFTVYPEEVEACIQNSRLARECVVYGRMDADGNETVCADIVPCGAEVDIEAVRRYLEEHLAVYKRPAHIAICDAIRRNAAGKIERRKEEMR